jgi:outer membrane protein OmpA-like peptidoglycan-associated protein
MLLRSFGLGAFRFGAFSLFVFLGSSAFNTVFAQGPTVSQSGGARTTDCNGGDAVLNGSGNSVNFRSRCRTLTVNGSGNAIKIELQSPGTITLNGTGNNVSYEPIGSTADAAVTDHGQGNTVTRRAAVPSGTTGNTTTITGSPANGLAIHGPNGESVQIGPNGIVAVPGPNQPGSSVVINPDGIAATAPSQSSNVATANGQLMLSGDAQTKDMSCDSADVYISGNNSRFTLRGGCKALFVHGNNNVVHVELNAGAQIAIQGDNALVYVRLTEARPNPKLLVNGQNSRVFLVQHLDDTTGTEVPASLRSGAVQDVAGAIVVASVRAPAVFLTPQAALSFARDQSLDVLQHDLGAVQTAEGRMVNLSGDVLFDFDEDQLRPDAQRSLAELAVLIERSHPHGLRIVGYTDSIGTPQYNLDLSGRRAHIVARWLRDYGRVQAAGLDVEGRGAADPVAPNVLPGGRDNPAGRQQNRRVTILLQQ